MSVVIDEVTDAKKVRFNSRQVMALAKTVATIISVRGKTVVRFDLKKDKPDNKTLLAALLGPTKNLRAPSWRIGKTLVVGFNQTAYVDPLIRELLAASRR